MTTPTPTLATAISAVKSVVSGVGSGVGVVLAFEHHLDSDVEYFEKNCLASGGTGQLWMVDLDNVEEIEGASAGEVYEIYHIRVRGLHVNRASTWSQDFKAKVESIRDALSGAASVFAIGGQRQLLTPETVSTPQYGKTGIDDQTVFQATLSLAVEARRW